MMKASKLGRRNGGAEEITISVENCCLKQRGKLEARSFNVCYRSLIATDDRLCTASKV